MKSSPFYPSPFARLDGRAGRRVRQLLRLVRRGLVFMGSMIAAGMVILAMAWIGRLF